MLLGSSLVALIVAVVQVSAHGYVPQIRIAGKDIPGWDVTKDASASPQPLRVVRPTLTDRGPILDVTSLNITCSIGNSKLPPGPIQATVAAGGTIELSWATWVTNHPGPIMNYMARCPTSDCSTFKADTGSPWFKIQQESWKNHVWPTDALNYVNNGTYTVQIPKNIASGSYLLRHELLALHAAGIPQGAQFYPVCVQLTVAGGGSLKPSGLSFPGTYTERDPGIRVNLFGMSDAALAAYVPPGGPVYPGLN